MTLARVLIFVGGALLAPVVLLPVGLFVNVLGRRQPVEPWTQMTSGVTAVEKIL